MALTKYFTAKIANILEANDIKHTEHWDRFKRRIASTNDPAFTPIKLDPERYLYVVNHSVSAYEFYGPNDNGDGFPSKELKERHYTFIGKPVTVDHIEHLRVGVILDSRYVEPTDPSNPRTGHYVQNVLAIDKKQADIVDPRLVKGIIDGKITDTSMGALVQYSQCSICGNIAHTEHEYCVHVANMKMNKIRLASGEERLVFEICHDFEFFEDSIIRPFDMGGLAGGRGADPKAKVLMFIGSLFNKTAKPKLPENTDALQQTPDTNDNEIPSPDEIIEKITKPTPDEREVPSPVEEPTKEKEGEAPPKTYDPEVVKEKLKKEVSPHSFNPRPEVEVKGRENLFSDMDTKKLPESFYDFLKRVMSSAEEPSNPKYEEIFKRIRDLVAQGLPTEKAVHLVWLEKQIQTEERGLELIEEALKTICPVDNYDIGIVGDKYVVTVINPTETCTCDTVSDLLKKVVPENIPYEVISNEPKQNG